MSQSEPMREPNMSQFTSRPILFSAPMVRALLDGTKTQTRRVVKSQPPEDVDRIVCEKYFPVVVDRNGEDQPGDEIFGAYSVCGEWGARCPYGQPGDRLWVRETHSVVPDHDEPAGYSAVLYKATDDKPFGKWTPSIHMRREYSRITLEIVSVRVERLQDISEQDCWAEGCEGTDDDVTGGTSGYGEYSRLWESINGPGSWDANPWVWAVEFKRLAP